MMDQPNKSDLAHCTYCPKLCRSVCPVAKVEHRETVTPWGLMGAISAQEKGQSLLSGEGAETLYHCTGCRRCQQHCQDHIAVPETIMAARAVVFQKGDAPAEAKALSATFKKHNNPYGRPLQEIRVSAFGEVGSHNKDGIFFPDCQTVARYPEHIAAAKRIFDHIGLSLSLPPGDVECCGATLYYAGDIAAFKAHAKGVHKALKQAPLIVMPSPGCAHILQDIYPKMGLKWAGKIRHPAQLLGERLPDLSLNSSGKKQKTVYQDPCHLARSLGVTELPRQLIAAATGAAPRDAFYNREATQCTGGGGALPALLPKVANKVTTEALQSLSPGSDERVVTACPGCKRRLERAGCQSPVSDLLEVIADALDTPSE